MLHIKRKPQQQHYKLNKENIERTIIVFEVHAAKTRAYGGLTCPLSANSKGAQEQKQCLLLKSCNAFLSLKNRYTQTHNFYRKGKNSLPYKTPFLQQTEQKQTKKIQKGNIMKNWCTI